MATRKTIWETTTYRHLEKGLPLEVALKCMGAKTPAEKQLALDWIKKNGAGIIQKYQQQEQSFQEAKEVFDIKD